MPPIRRSKPSYPRFSEEEYRQNATAIKKLNDAAYDYCEALQQEFEALELEKSRLENLLQRKEAEIALLQQPLQQTSRISLLQSLLLIIATILFGFGVNLATSSPHEWVGWVLSITGTLLQVFTIIITVLPKSQGSN